MCRFQRYATYLFCNDVARVLGDGKEWKLELLSEGWIWEMNVKSSMLSCSNHDSLVLYSIGYPFPIVQLK